MCESVTSDKSQAAPLSYWVWCVTCGVQCQWRYDRAFEVLISVYMLDEYLDNNNNVKYTRHGVWLKRYQFTLYSTSAFNGSYFHHLDWRWMVRWIHWLNSWTLFIICDTGDSHEVRFKYISALWIKLHCI